ncbi:hypothetical protein EDB83DRAFT_2315293 [Lactarius deliciosus]|nr:hypothetical protein EDB83DRAFT_2315293 [Lactarius deliciosus]
MYCVLNDSVAPPSTISICGTRVTLGNKAQEAHIGVDDWHDSTEWIRTGEVCADTRSASLRCVGPATCICLGGVDISYDLPREGARQPNQMYAKLDLVHEYDPMWSSERTVCQQEERKERIQMQRLDVTRETERGIGACTCAGYFLLHVDFFFNKTSSNSGVARPSGLYSVKICLEVGTDDDDDDDVDDADEVERAVTICGGAYWGIGATSGGVVGCVLGGEGGFCRYAEGTPRAYFDGGGGLGIAPLTMIREWVVAEGVKLERRRGHDDDSGIPSSARNGHTDSEDGNAAGEGCAPLAVPACSEES